MLSRLVATNRLHLVSTGFKAANLSFGSHTLLFCELARSLSLSLVARHSIVADGALEKGRFGVDRHKHVKEDLK